MKTLRLNTPVDVPRAAFEIGYDDRVLLHGSCFTENIGRRMADAGFTTLINPFGILYNPLSMAVALDYCLDDSEIGEEALVARDGLWHSWLHHGSFSRVERQGCVDACNDAIHRAHAFLQGCNTVIVTFGSAWCYALRDTRTVVANCHKMPAAMFDKRLATVDEVVDAWATVVARLVAAGVRVVFSISPVRHQAYGAHGNQIGKAVLLLALERIVGEAATKGGDVFYFPAYEIVVDELRDYRFYADDMAHPSPLAEQIVWRRFQETFMSPATQGRCEMAEKESRRAAHRPLHGDA